MHFDWWRSRVVPSVRHRRPRCGQRQYSGFRSGERMRRALFASATKSSLPPRLTVKYILTLPPRLMSEWVLLLIILFANGVLILERCPLMLPHDMTRTSFKFQPCGLSIFDPYELFRIPRPCGHKIFSQIPDNGKMTDVILVIWLLRTIENQVGTID